MFPGKDLTRSGLNHPTCVRFWQILLQKSVEGFREQ
jgi:hypothetical protein